MGAPITVTVGPLATADDNGVSLSQSAAGAQFLAINGALAAGTFSATSICAAQTASGAEDLLINGSLATTNPVAGYGGTGSPVPATARFAVPVRPTITSSGDDTGVTFTIVGTIQSVNSFGPGAVISETLAGANAGVIAATNLYSSILSISTDGATDGDVTVGHSGVAMMDLARRIIITSASDDTGVTFVLTGTDWAQNPISESIIGASGAAATSVLDYLTVTSISTSGATAGAVIVGTSDVSGSQWVRFDDFGANAQVAIQATVSGTVSGQVQQTLDDPNVITNQLPTPTYQIARSDVAWLPHPTAALATLTATAQGNYAYPPLFARVVLNSGTGSIRVTFRQVYLN